MAMPRIAVRKLELCETISAPQAVEDYEGVRFYCTLHGQVLGHFTIWNNYRSIGREWLLTEIIRNHAPLLNQLILGQSNKSTDSAKSAIEQLITQYLTARQEEA